MPETAPPHSSRAWKLQALASAVLCVLLTLLAPGCRKAQPSAEQRALERHKREVSQVKRWQAYFRSAESARTRKALGLLEALANNGQLLGVPPSQHEGQVIGFNLTRPVVSPKGPYYWSQQFDVIFADTPPRRCHYVVVQPYRNGEFQLQKAWRSDEAGKIIEESPLVPAAAMGDPHQVFLGPANAGAERGWAGWFNGRLGSGSVAIGTNDPATGLNCFEIGITNAVAGQTHHADIRSETFPLVGARARGPYTLTFAYKLPTQVKPGDNIEVNFRFFGKGDSQFLGQQTVAVGAASGDSEMKQYKTRTLSGIQAPAGAVKADIWIVANLGDPWTSGTALFDDFAVTGPPPPFWRLKVVQLGAVTALMLALAGALCFRHRRRRAAGAMGNQSPPLMREPK
jgi:hypothetical protein